MEFYAQAISAGVRIDVTSPQYNHSLFLQALAARDELPVSAVLQYVAALQVSSPFSDYVPMSGRHIADVHPSLNVWLGRIPNIEHLPRNINQSSAGSLGTLPPSKELGAYAQFVSLSAQNRAHFTQTDVYYSLLVGCKFAHRRIDKRRMNQIKLSLCIYDSLAEDASLAADALAHALHLAAKYPAVFSAHKEDLSQMFQRMERDGELQLDSAQLEALASLLGDKISTDPLSTIHWEVAGYYRGYPIHLREPSRKELDSFSFPGLSPCVSVNETNLMQENVCDYLDFDRYDYHTSGSVYTFTRDEFSHILQAKKNPYTNLEMGACALSAIEGRNAAAATLGLPPCVPFAELKLPSHVGELYTPEPPQLGSRRYRGIDLSWFGSPEQEEVAQINCPVQ